MKTELLIKLRDQIKDRPSLDSGLCHEVSEMLANGDIYIHDWSELFHFIRVNRPRRRKHYDSLCKGNLWYWPMGYVEPRLDWLNGIIAKRQKK